MNKKLAVLLSLALVLVALCAFASAETKLELYTPNGQGTAVPYRAVSKTLDAESKALVDVYPNRGATVTLWYWGDGTGCYNMKTGNMVDQVRYTVRGNKFGAQVISGSSWLGLYNKDGFGSFGWDMTNNVSTAARKGKIRVYDSYGTICYIEIRQCCEMDIVKVSQPAGVKNNGRVRVQSTRASGTHGKIYYNLGSEYPFGSYVGVDANGYAEYELSYAEEQYLLNNMRAKKYTKGTIWFHPNRTVGTWQYYYLRPYRVMGGVTIQGPMTTLWSVEVEH